MRVCRLGAFPQWHLQGLRPTARTALVAACLGSLEAAVAQLPADAVCALPMAAAADAAIALVLVAAARGYTAVTACDSGALSAEAWQCIAQLRRATANGAPTAAGAHVPGAPAPDAVTKLEPSRLQS